MQTQLHPSLQQLLRRVRRALQIYIVAETIAVVAICLALAFWISLGVDYSLELPVSLRALAQITLGTALCGVVYRWWVQRALTPIRDSSLALLLERRFRSLDESLLTAVELADGPEQGTGFHDELFEATRVRALDRVRSLDPGKLFNWRALGRKSALALAGVVSIVVFAAVATPAFAVWADRNLLLSKEVWPRRTRLAVEGFADGRIKVAKGSDTQVVVLADATMPWVPETVEIRYVRDGAAGRERMDRLGEAAAGDPFQRFGLTFKGLLGPVDLEIRGGDDRIRDLHIEVVDSPVLTEMTVGLVYPAYMQRSPRDMRVTGLMQAPVGSEMTVRSGSNKPLSTIDIHRLAGEKTELLASYPAITLGPLAMDYQVGKVDGDQTLLFTLQDQDGIASREPVRLSLTAIPDEPPRLTVRPWAIGAAVTPQAQLPWRGEISDDYGLSSVKFDWRIGDNEPAELPITVALSDADGVVDSVTFDGINTPALDLQPLGLKPGDRVDVGVKAVDHFNLAEDPNVGSSERFPLEVVTASQLMAMLEARELMLRRRFEVVVDSIVQIRDNLAKDSAVGSADANAAPAGATSAGNAESNAQPDAALDDDPLIQVRRSLATAGHSTQEIASLSQAFSDIYAELENNRIAIAEKKSRLVDRIAKPLAVVAEQRLPELEGSLRRLEQTGRNQDPAEWRIARGQADGIVVELNRILQEMLEAEEYNVLVDRMREVIELQTKLNRRTKERQKQAARELLQ